MGAPAPDDDGSRERSEATEPHAAETRPYPNLVRKGMGRPLGAVNYLSRTAKQCLKQSLDEYERNGERGAVAYFSMLRDEYPPLYVQLVSKAFLPTQIKAEVDPASALGQLLDAVRARRDQLRANALTSGTRDAVDIVPYIPPR
jgi:hypothetical protein